MAEAAFQNTKRKMDADTEASLAALIMKDVSQLSELAQDRGVTAYRLRPVQREKPNERFLRGTLRSVHFGEWRFSTIYAYQDKLGAREFASSGCTAGFLTAMLAIMQLIGRLRKMRCGTSAVCSCNDCEGS